ncbi:DUF1499 domain-containing protein [Marinomonas dokdonensis]|uniref:DUF1499 domain-containing protein n=1 Tax=Marinomonas dokdonensis TaxID=328224 RepID=UPI0040554BED
MVRGIAFFIALLVVGFFVYVHYYNEQPNDLGVTDGLLKACPTSPNCVSSQAERSDDVHYVESIIYRDNRKDVQLSLESFLLNQGNARIVSSTLGYVHLEIKSKYIGYIDDVEFYLPEADSVIHVRSASRVGYSDVGVNRERVEQVRAFLTQ